MLTGEFTAVSVTRVREAIRVASPGARVYQASASEMLGKVVDVPRAISPNLLLPAEVDRLVGDLAKGGQKLGWKCSISFETLEGEMVESISALVRDQPHKVCVFLP